MLAYLALIFFAVVSIGYLVFIIERYHRRFRPHHQFWAFVLILSNLAVCLVIYWAFSDLWSVADSASAGGQSLKTSIVIAYFTIMALMIILTRSLYAVSKQRWRLKKKMSIYRSGTERKIA